MSSEGDGGEVVSGATTLMVTGLTSDQLAVTTAADEAVQQATIQAVLQAAGKRPTCCTVNQQQGAPLWLLHTDHKPFLLGCFFSHSSYLSS